MSELTAAERRKRAMDVQRQKGREAKAKKEESKKNEPDVGFIERTRRALGTSGKRPVGSETRQYGAKPDQKVADMKVPKKPTQTPTKPSDKPTTIAQAKKQGSAYYWKDGKKMAAVTAEDLKKSGMSLRDYMNKKTGKTRRQPSAEELNKKELERISSKKKCGGKVHRKTGGKVGRGKKANCRSGGKAMKGW